MDLARAESICDRQQVPESCREGDRESQRQSGVVLFVDKLQRLTLASDSSKERL